MRERHDRVVSSEGLVIAAGQTDANAEHDNGPTRAAVFDRATIGELGFIVEAGGRSGDPRALLERV